MHYISISRGFGDDMFICDVSCLGLVQYQRDQGGLAMCSYVMCPVVGRYGIKEIKGVRRLSGEGLETKDVPGVMQGGGKWPFR